MPCANHKGDRRWRVTWELQFFEKFGTFTEKLSGMYEYKAKLERVVDGDTLDLVIDLGFKMTTEQRIRLKGVDTPEIWRQKKDSDEYKAGMAAVQYVKKRLEQNHNEMIIRTGKLTGVYGRYIGEVILADSKKSLNQELIDTGHAKAYP